MFEGFGIEWMISLFTLTALEIVLGIDNIVLISVIADRVPEAERASLRRLGLGIALIARIALLFTISWVARLTAPAFTILEHAFSWRDLFLLGGGLFLLAKATSEIFNFMEARDQHHHIDPETATMGPRWNLILQIVAFDLVFSLDSVLTAVGLTEHLTVMVLAVIISIVFMMIFANAIGDFVGRHPSIKLLALAFLVLIAVLLIAEGFGSHFNRGYVYFAMVFALAIELLKMRRQRKARKIVPSVKPVGQ